MQQEYTATPAAALLDPVPVLYVRSAVHNEDELRQRVEDTHELARSQGLDVADADVIVETGSGTSIDGRLGLQQLLLRAARGEISHLVAENTSRLSRDYHDLRQILITLAEAGVTVVMGDSSDLSFGGDAFAAALASRR